MLFRPRARHKRFDYTPRYYDPSKEQDLRRRIRIKSRSRRKDPTGLFYTLLLLALTIWLITRF